MGLTLAVNHFIEPLVLHHFNEKLRMLVVIDASKYAVAVILLQSGDDLPVEPRPYDWHPGAYFRG